MNKNIQFFLAIIMTVLLTLVIYSNIGAQNADSIDVKYLVQKQFEEAKRKSLAEVAKNEKSEVITAKNSIVTETGLTGIPDDYFYKGLVMLTGTAVAFSWVKLRRFKRKKVFKNSQFKKNVKLMREEKFIKEIDPKLKEIRTKLTLTSVILNEDKKISAAARKSQIGKEEILLASRIRSHEMQYRGQRSWA